MKKEIIISFILGAIISSVVGVIAANTISSSSIIYKDNKTVNTVLDELFENVDAIESDDTRLTSLEGKVNTLTSTHSSDITRIDNSVIDNISRIDDVKKMIPKYFVGAIKTVTVQANEYNPISIDKSDILTAFSNNNISVNEVLSFNIIGVDGFTDTSSLLMKTSTGGTGNWAWAAISSAISQDIRIYCYVVYR